MFETELTVERASINECLNQDAESLMCVSHQAQFDLQITALKPCFEDTKHLSQIHNQF